MNQMKYLIQASLLVVLVVSTLSFVSFISAAAFNATEDLSAFSETSSTENISTPHFSGKGKVLFQQNCQSCHALDKPGTGPALREFTERGPWSDSKKVLAWVQNPVKFMQTDPYTRNLQKQFTVTMQAFPQMTQDDIDQIIGYLNQPAYSPRQSTP